MSRAGRLFRRMGRNRLAACRSGVAMTEFALAMPLLMTVGMWGAETAHLAVTNMRVSQLAMQIADNASRIGDTSALQNLKIYESDIDDLLDGANIQASSLKIFDHGRVIISSLETVPGTTATQYIHWQRCKGKKKKNSVYGGEGKGTDGSLAGMGPSGDIVTASPGDAVMFVEIYYDYQPLIANMFTGANTPREIHTSATFIVRDDRDLAQIYQRDTTSPAPVANCAVFDGFTA